MQTIAAPVSPPLAEMLIVLDSPLIPLDAYQARFTVLTLHQDGRLMSLQGADVAAAPQAALAIIVPPAAAKSKEIIAWAARQKLAAPVIPHGDGLAALLAALAAQRAYASRRVTELALDLAELRMAHTDLRASHDALMAVLRETGLLLPRLGLEIAPDPTAPPLAQTATEITQPIDLDLRTLCGVALHLAERSAGFTLELRAADDDRPVMAWTVPAGTHAGWFGFAFAAAAARPAGSAAIRVRWEGEAPKLSLGRSTRALALRVFVSAPGAPVMVTRDMWPQPKPVTRVDLRLDERLTVVDLRNLHEKAHFPPVQLLADQGQIQVHPLDESPTIASLPAICPPGTQAVQARVATANPAAGPIEYGLHVASRQLDYDLVAWTTVTAGHESLLRLELEDPLDTPADLLLLTRLPPGASASACWARFLAVQFHGAFDGA